MGFLGPTFGTPVIVLAMAVRQAAIGYSSVCY